MTRQKTKTPKHEPVVQTVWIKDRIDLECHTATPTWFVECAPEMYKSMVLNKDMGLRAARKVISEQSDRLVELIRDGYTMTCQCKEGKHFKPHRTVLDVIRCKACKDYSEMVSPEFSKTFPNGQTLSVAATFTTYRKVFVLESGYYEKI